MAEKPKRQRKPNRPHAKLPVHKVLAVAKTIHEKSAGMPMNRVRLGAALDYNPTSGPFGLVLTSSAKYGLTKGGLAATNVSIQPLGTEFAETKDDIKRLRLMRQAFRNVSVFDKMLTNLSNKRLPDVDDLASVLLGPPFKVGEDWAKEIATSFHENVDSLKYLDHGYIVLDEPETEQGELSSPQEPALDTGDDEPEPHPAEEPLEPPTTPIAFIAHGKTREPVDQLSRELTKLSVEHKIAEDEPHAGRPISEKVADTMKQCTFGIFIFTPDEEFKTLDDRTVYRPSQNVIYELGAASLLYGRKIVIFKHSKVNFPSDFSDLGWIGFEDDLAASSGNLIQELLGIGALRLAAGF